MAASQQPSTVAGPKVQEAKARAKAALETATSDHQATIHLARFALLLDLYLQRKELTTAQLEQWKAAVGFFGAVVGTNDKLADYQRAPEGTLRIRDEEFATPGAPPASYRRGIEPAAAQALVDSESAARSTAVTAESTARTAAIAAEASARTAAIAAEVTARNGAIATATQWAVSSVSRTLGTAYQPNASKDVLIVATGQIVQTGATADGQVVLYSDSGTSPTTIRGVVRGGAGTGTINGVLVYLVPRGHYYKIDTNQLVATASFSLVGGVVHEITLG